MKLSTRCAHQIHYPNQERSSVRDESAPDCDKCRLNKLTKKRPFKGFGNSIVSIPHNWVSSLCVCVSSYIVFCTFTSQLLCESIIVSDEIWSLSTCHQQMVNTRPTNFVFLILTQCFCVIRCLLAQQIQASCSNWVHELGEPQKYLECK
jgi:hypothetical protein